MTQQQSSTAKLSDRSVRTGDLCLGPKPSQNDTHQQHDTLTVTFSFSFRNSEISTIQRLNPIFACFSPLFSIQRCHCAMLGAALPPRPPGGAPPKELPPAGQRRLPDGRRPDHLWSVPGLERWLGIFLWVFQQFLIPSGTDCYITIENHHLNDMII